MDPRLGGPAGRRQKTRLPSLPGGACIGGSKPGAGLPACALPVQNITGAPAQPARGKRRPFLLWPPACCLGWAGPVPLEVCLLAASPAPFHPLVHRLSAEGSHMVLCGRVSLVQYLPGVNAEPAPCVSCPSPPPPPHPPQPAQREWQVVGGRTHGESGEPCRVGVSEESFSNTHPHTHTENC